MIVVHGDDPAAPRRTFSVVLVGQQDLDGTGHVGSMHLLPASAALDHLALYHGLDQIEPFAALNRSGNPVDAGGP